MLFALPPPTPLWIWAYWWVVVETECVIPESFLSPAVPTQIPAPAWQRLWSGLDECTKTCPSLGPHVPPSP